MSLERYTVVLTVTPAEPPELSGIQFGSCEVSFWNGYTPDRFDRALGLSVLRIITMLSSPASCRAARRLPGETTQIDRGAEARPERRRNPPGQARPSTATRRAVPRRTSVALLHLSPRWRCLPLVVDQLLVRSAARIAVPLGVSCGRARPLAPGAFPGSG